MSAYIVSPEARADLVSIWRYFALEVGDVDLADRILAEIVRGFQKLARTPGLGHFRSDLADSPLRFWSVRQYLIIYQSEVRPIEVVRVLNGARDVQAILDG
jgi:plasmid stabilization system protein ParE